MKIKGTQVAVVAAISGVLLTGCGGAGPTAHISATTSDPRAEPGAAPREGERNQSDPDHVVELHASRVRQYFLPSVQEFAGSELITEVVIGTVVRTESLVVEPGTEVYTLVTLEVESSRSGGAGELLTVRENGGVVTLGEVAQEFEGRVDPKEIEDRADELVDYRFEGQANSEVGDQLLVFVGGTPGDDEGGQFSAARMKLDGSDVFHWVGEPVNEEWVASMRKSESENEFGLRR